MNEVKWYTCGPCCNVFYNVIYMMCVCAGGEGLGGK